MKRRRLTKKSSVSLPPDLVIEILKRFPVKFVTKCLLVSKVWATIIRSQDFIRSFPFPSPHHQDPWQIPFLLALNSIDHKFSGHSKWFFFLSSSSLLASSSHHRVPSPLSLTKCQIPHRRLCLSDVHYVNGLLSLGYGQQQIINNPSTGKSIYLPKVRSRKQIIQSYFGFDPVECRYKVLCMAERMNDYSNVSSSDHQVFTLGGGIEKQSWRMIECDTPHCPKTNGVCIDGVLYYGAFTGSDMMEWCVMRFDVNTEKLDLRSRLYEEVVLFRRRHSPSLINYHGKVALASETSLNTFDLWVMEDAEKWCKVRFSIGIRLSGDAELCIRGTIHTGEIVLFYRDGGAGVTHAVFCDHKENRVRQAQFRLGTTGLPEFSRDVSLVVPFFNYVESAMLL